MKQKLVKPSDVIKIPKPYYDDHVSRGYKAPKILKENRANYFIDASDKEGIQELIAEAKPFAELYRSGYCYHLSNLAVSANHTLIAIGMPRADKDYLESIAFAKYHESGY